MTLRQINHNKPLFDYDMGMHMTKSMNRLQQIYSQRRIEAFTCEEISLVLEHKLMPEHTVEMGLEWLTRSYQNKENINPIQLLLALATQDKAYWDTHQDQYKQYIKYLTFYDEQIAKAKYFMGLISLEEYREIEAGKDQAFGFSSK